MIAKRPRYPVGHSVAGLPPIAKPLHSEDRCELYSLGFDGPNQTVLFVAQSSNSVSDCRRLFDWWAIQPGNVLKAAEPLGQSDRLLRSCSATLKIEGHCIASEDFSDASEETLRRLLGSMLDLVERGMSVEMFPDFELSLMWSAPDRSAICAVMPLDGSLPESDEQVRLVGRAFYRIASGIDIEELKGTLPLLSKWSKFAGNELSSIIERSLAPAASKSRVTTLSTLNTLLGRETGVETAKQTVKSQAVSARDAEPTGLAKVAGMHGLKDLLYREVVAPIRNPEPHKRYGLSIPNGILLYGPPGCGKTYIARQLAEELGHYFVEIIPSELASPYVHGSVTHIRDLFDSAAAQAPAIVFIDEFEALVPTRGELGGFQQHKAEEVNEFLAHLNGCADKGIFVIAATNEPTKIDPAVRRTGRLDKMIYVGPPDAEARKEMLALHLQKRPLDADVDLMALALSLAGYSASDIRFLVDEAAREALKHGGDITSESFRFAVRRVPPSVTAEIEEQHRSIDQRGV
jgi:AAA+ superfamily predicted ATPase